MFQDFHLFWLINEIDCSFLYIHKLLNYDMNIFKNAIKKDKLWFLDNDYYFYDNQEFEILKWKEIIKNIHRKAKSILNKQLLFRDLDKIESINLYIYINSENNFNNNDYFATMILDHKNIIKWIIINILMKSKKWNQMIIIENKQLVFLIININEYIKYDTEFQELILLMIN